MIALPKSLSVRLLLVFVASAATILLVLSALFSYGISTEWRQQIQPHLAQYVRYVRADLGDPPSIQRADELTATLPVDIHIFKQGEHVHSTNNKKFDPSNYEFTTSKRRPCPRPPGLTREKREKSERPPAKLEFAQKRHHSVVKIPMENHSVYVELDRNFGARASKRTHIWLLPVVVLALLGALYLLLRRLLSPISDIKAGVAVMTSGDLSHRIEVSRKDDLGQLADSVNGLSQRIQTLLDAKRELLLSVSHELRSPLTRANLAATMLPPSKLQERVLDELRLLDSLIEALMESERLQSEHSVLNISTVNFQELLQHCLQQAEAEHLGEFGQVSFTYSGGNSEAPNTDIQGDEVRLRLMCRNLLNNAVQHGKSVTDGGTTPQLNLDITLNTNTDNIQCVIADRGPGVAPSELASLTEPFYRPDPSRTHGSGGVGLGLSLAKLIAEAHQGSLTLTNRQQPDSGLVATLILSRGTQSKPAEA